MSKLLVTNFILFFFQFFAFAQPLKPYKPLSFINYKPEWYHTAIDSSSIGGLFDGYNIVNTIFFVDPIVHKNSIYTVYRASGILIQKLDLNTGAILWQVNMPTDSLKRNELPQLMYVNDDDNLVLVSHRSLSNTFLSGYWIGDNNSKLSYRVFDGKSGKPINTFFSEDEINSPILGHAGLFQGFFTSYTYKEKNNLFRYFQADKKRKILKSYLLNEKGKLLEADSMSLNNKYTFFQMTKINENKYLVYDVVPIENKLIFDYYDKNLNLIESKFIILPDEIVFLKIDRIAENDIVIKNIIDIESKVIRYHVDLTNFGILERLVFEGKCNIDAPFTIYDGKLLTINNCFESPYSFLTFNVTDKNGSLVPVNKLIIEDTLKVGIVQEFKIVNGDKVLLFLGEKSLREGPIKITDTEASARSVMMLQSKLIDWASEVNNISNSLAYKVYPNPSSDNIYFKFENQISGKIEILNQLGQSIYSLKVEKEVQIKIDVSSFNNGMYYPKLTDENNIITLLKPIVKIH